MALIATSLKLPRTLKDRIARLAKRSGESSHALMLRLLEEQVQATERFEEFLVAARKADERMQESGTGYAAPDVHAYLVGKVSGHKVTAPKRVQWRK